MTGIINLVIIFIFFHKKIHLNIMVTKESLSEGKQVELIENLPGREKGILGTIQEIEELDYEIVAVWIRWTELGRPDRFDLDHEPNILSKIKII